MQAALALCECREVPFVPHSRRRESLHARVLARLGWALEVVEGEEHEAREKYRQAHEHDPANPYYLAQMLGFEMYTSRSEGLPDCMRATIREAIKTCREHAPAAIELPYAYFTAGRLSLLIGEDYEALGYVKQAKYSVAILEAVGFGVRQVDGEPVILDDFTEDEVEQMAELEHGRWNVERLRDGWRPGQKRDDAQKVHDCLVPWADLPEHIKKYDHQAVRAFPEILAKAKLEVYRSNSATG